MRKTRLLAGFSIESSRSGLIYKRFGPPACLESHRHGACVLKSAVYYWAFSGRVPGVCLPDLSSALL